MLRISGKRTATMAQDGAVADVIEFEKPSVTALKRIVAEIDFGKVLKWDDVDTALEQFYALCNRPPLHSVVIQFSPDVASRLYELTNTKNRPLAKTLSGHVADRLREGDYEVTGDTLKWSKSAIMLDGQHRLDGCRKSKKPLTSHVVFGLPDDIFDVLDQGKKRSPGDVLALLGVKDHNIVAGSVRQAKMYLEGRKGNEIHGLTARRIKELATGPMQDIQEFTSLGRLVSQAFKHPPSMITAILYMIAQHSKLAAKNFAHEWVHGARVGRNENFDVLNGRLMAVARQGGGHINRQVRAAMIIQTFNHWYADVVANPRAITWRKEWDFPKLEFNKAAFLKRRETANFEDTSMETQKQRLLIVLAKAVAKDGTVSLPFPEIGKRANIPANQVASVLAEMENTDLIHCARRHGKSGAAIYNFKDAGMKRLRAIAESNGAGK